MCGTAMALHKVVKAVVLAAVLCTAAASSRARILVVYYSQSNHTASLAQAVADGAAQHADIVDVRGPLSIDNATFADDVMWADAVIVGSPVHNANIAAKMKAWLDTWDYVHQDLHTKIGAPFVTGGHLYGGIETTLHALTAYFHIFAMRVVTAERDFQPHFPLGVGATTGDPPFKNESAGKDGFVDPIFVDAGNRLGERVARIAAAAAAVRARPGL